MKRAAKRKNAPKWRVRQRVRKALKKYVRKGNAGRRRKRNAGAGRWGGYGSPADQGRAAAREDARKVKGRKVKGGRAVTLKNFTGTVVRKANGQVQIVGKGRKR